MSEAWFEDRCPLKEWCYPDECCDDPDECRHLAAGLRAKDKGEVRDDNPKTS
jgi:hypothetical protein